MSDMNITIDGQSTVAVKAITEVERSLEKLVSTATRNTQVVRDSLNSIGNGRVRSAFLDNFERQLEQAEARARATSDRINRDLTRVGSSAGRGAGGATLGGNAIGAISDAASSAVPGLSRLTSGLGAVGIAAVGIGAAAVAVGAVGAKAIDAASKVEIWKANLLTITGSSQKAEESYAALVNFASKTPFDLGQSVEGFTKLRTLGLEATEEALTSFGNTAAAMGKPLSQMIEAVADASTGEFERLKEFGIKSKTQGDQVAFTFQGVTTKVANNSKAIQGYLEGIGNTKFAGAMERQMNTITGALSNVEDSIFQAFAAMGDGTLGDTIKSILKDVAAAITTLTPSFDLMGTIIGNLVAGFVEFQGALGNIFGQFTTGQDSVNSLNQVLDVTGAAVKLVFDVLTLLANGIAIVVKAVADFIGALSPASAAMDSTGKSAGSLRDQFADALGAMAATAYRIVGGIVSRFEFLKAAVRNVIAGINNSAIDAGVGKFIGITQRMETVDPSAAAAKVTAEYEKMATAAQKVVTQRYKATQEDKKVTPKLDAGTAATPAASSKKDSDAAKAAKKAADEAKKATEDYNKVVKDLTSSKEDLGRTQDQITLLDNLERAGLKRSMDVFSSANKLTRERAENIRKLTQEYLKLSQARKIDTFKSEDSIEKGTAFEPGAEAPNDDDTRKALARYNAYGDEMLRQRLKLRKEFGLNSELSSIQQGLFGQGPDTRNENEKSSDALADQEARTKVRVDGLKRQQRGLDELADAERRLQQAQRDGRKDETTLQSAFGSFEDKAAAGREQVQKRIQDLMGTIDRNAEQDAELQRLLNKFYNLPAGTNAPMPGPDLPDFDAARPEGQRLDDKINVKRSPELDNELAQINERLEARRKEIADMDIAKSKKEELLELEEKIAQTERDNARDAAGQKQQKDALQVAETLYDTMQGLWENPRQAMEQFFSSFLRQIAVAIIKSAILGEKLGGGKGFGSVISGALSSALGFGGARAAGGSVSSGSAYLVGEQGPEIFAPGRSGSIVPHYQISGNGNNSNPNMSISTNITIANTNGQDSEQTALKVAEKQKRVITDVVRAELNRRGK